MFVLGMDIGYSNLKLAIRQSGGKPDVSLHPAGAAPADRLPESIGKQENALRVSLDGKLWAVGVQHGKFSLWSRSLHGDYVETPSYRALFLARFWQCALASCWWQVGVETPMRWLRAKSRCQRKTKASLW